VLQLEVASSILGPSVFPTKRKKREEVVLPTETELDRLLISTLEAGKDDTKKAERLFSQVFVNTNPVVVTISGVCKNSGKHTAHAGASAYFGQNSGLNRAVRVWGKQTNSRADIVALLIAIQTAPRMKTLHISTRSEYAIRAVKYYAYRNEACGWECPNGDVLRLIIQWIKCRSAPIPFIHIVKGCPTPPLKEALVEAEKGANLPRCDPPQTPAPMLSFNIQPLKIDKVSTDIPNDAGESAPEHIPKRAPCPVAHRGRERLYLMRDQNAQNLIGAPSNAVFWKEYRTFADPAPIPISVTAEA
jgi:ribonuclease HI